MLPLGDEARVAIEEILGAIPIQEEAVAEGRLACVFLASFCAMDTWDFVSELTL
jgi:hypothetical protein